MKSLNGIDFKLMLQSGASNLANHHTEIDALNVFPVPDGDTGTNMSMTFTSGVKDAINSLSDDLSVIAKALSKGLLMGARGNSGVILSQIFRGVYQSVDGKQDLNANDLADAFVKGSEVAYKAVMRPVEGTILTVIRESSYYAKQYVIANPEIDVLQFFDVLIGYAKESLDNTPELLPVLKEVGVVDSGGAGLLVIFVGFKAALNGNPIEAKANDSQTSSAALNLENDEFGYCTEFILKLSEIGVSSFTEDKLKKKLASLGDSIVVVQDEDLVKVHVHTLTPGDALNFAQRYGEFVKLKIENMQEQHNNLPEQTQQQVVKPRQKYAIISVAAGDGLVDLFKQYRCDYVIEGGQTMNPSTEDFVAAINKVNAEHILILPNNSNIILAAQQAAAVLEDLNITVLPTKSIPQGLSACIMFNPEVEISENIEEMTTAINHVKTAQVTYAIKDTTFEGLEIHSQDFMGMYEKNIIIATPILRDALVKLVDELIDEDSEIMTLIVGCDAFAEDVEFVTEYVNSKYDLEIEVHQGNQPVYCFIMGVE